MKDVPVSGMHFNVSTSQRAGSLKGLFETSGLKRLLEGKTFKRGHDLSFRSGIYGKKIWNLPKPGPYKTSDTIL